MGRDPTSKQTQFAAGIVSGLSKTDAYSRAHPNDHSSRRMLRIEASRQSKSPAVLAEIQRLRSEPIILEQFPESNNPQALRAHVLATITRLTGHPDPAVQFHAARWLYDYASSLESHPETTDDRQALIAGLQQLYQKALHQTPLIETVAQSETAAGEPTEQ